jgi:uncharacterized protein YeaO (DUF488 family)
LAEGKIFHKQSRPFRQVFRISPDDRLPMIKTDKTVYDKREGSDGKRILVMRIWPRGVSKNKVDVWMKELGTEKDLIKKWKLGKISWANFASDYRRSLRGKEDILKKLAGESEKEDITLLCSDKDASHCHRTLLASEIEKYVKKT